MFGNFKSQGTFIADWDLLVVEVFIPDYRIVLALAIHEVSHVIMFIAGQAAYWPLSLEDVIRLCREIAPDLRSWAGKVSYEFTPPQSLVFPGKMITKTSFDEKSGIIDEDGRTLFSLKKDFSAGHAGVSIQPVLHEWIEIETLLESLTAAQTAFAGGSPSN